MNMNKILVVLVIGIALIGLTGVASACIDTETDIWGTYFTSESSLSVYNFPIVESYQSTLIAEFVYPIFPPVDLSYTEIEISGDTFVESTEVISTPTGSNTILELSDVSAVEGHILIYTCVDIGTGMGPTYYELPQPYLGVPATLEWYSIHPEGATEFAEFHEITSIFWP